MADLNFTKIKQPYAHEICQKLELDEAASLLLTQGISPAAYLEQLITNELYPDAVRFLATALPKREATWWACLSARHTLTESTPAREVKAIESAEAWVYKPTKELCQLTLPAAEATDYKTAAGWAAIAAFWSGDNISPVAGTVVPPAEDLTAKAVSGAVMLAATAGKAESVNSNYQLFLQQGIHIACGGDGRAIQLTAKQEQSWDSPPQE
jgi:hypothetical protein